jgi:hypothetical protein
MGFFGAQTLAKAQGEAGSNDLYHRPEIWKPVPGSDGLCASNNGRTKRASFMSSDGRVWAESIVEHSGKVRAYAKIGKDKQIAVAAVVLLAFRGPPPTKYGSGKGCSLARHLDDDCTNNYLENLAWGTKGDNIRDAHRNGRKIWVGGKPLSKVHKKKISIALRGKPHTAEHNRKVGDSLRGSKSSSSKLTEDDVRFIIENYKPYHQEFGGGALAKRFGVGKATISLICSGQTWKHVCRGK